MVPQCKLNSILNEAEYVQSPCNLLTAALDHGVPIGIVISYDMMYPIFPKCYIYEYTSQFFFFLLLLQSFSCFTIKPQVDSFSNTILRNNIEWGIKLRLLSQMVRTFFINQFFNKYHRMILRMKVLQKKLKIMYSLLLFKRQMFNAHSYKVTKEKNL